MSSALSDRMIAMIGFLKRLFGTDEGTTGVAGTTDTASTTSTVDTADTFLEATNGGWGDTPDVIPANGGSQRSYVESQLELAKQEAANMAIGESFTYRLTDIPIDIDSPHEISFGMLMRSHEYGLRAGLMVNEEIVLTRIA